MTLSDTRPVHREDSAPADLNVLRTFLAVYRAGSFTAAAAKLGLSQPTVTSQIRSLERQTSRQLFKRLPRGVEPTAFAHELATHVSSPLDALGAIGTEDGRIGARSAPVHVAGPSELLCTRVLPALAGLVASGVQLRVAQGQTEQLLDELRAGQHDLVIITRRPRGRALESFALTDEEYTLIASPMWAERIQGHEDEPVCAALRTVPLVAYAEDMPIVRRYCRTVFGKQHPPVEPALTVPNLHAVVSAVAAGAGYSVVPRAICEEHIDDGRVVEINPSTETPLNTLFLVQRPGAETNPAVARVRDTLREAAQGW